MTDPRPPLAPAATPAASGVDLGGALLRAFGAAAAVVVGIGVAAGVVLFVWPGLLPADAMAFYATGLGAALLAGMVALWLHGRFLDPAATAPFAKDGRLLAGRLQSLLAAAFAAKLAVLVAGVLVLRAAGVKFADAATFAVTFAGGALLCQLATAFSLARAVQQRGATSAGAPTASSPGGSRP
jgi:hypothetical protein